MVDTSTTGSGVVGQGEPYPGVDLAEKNHCLQIRHFIILYQLEESDYEPICSETYGHWQIGVDIA